MKVADIKLEWSKSPSTNVNRNEIAVVIDGTQSQLLSFGNEVESCMIEVKARSSVVVTATTIDADGDKVQAEQYTFVVGDLEAPQPLSNFRHSVVAVRDVPDLDPVPEPGTEDGGTEPAPAE